MKTIIQFVNVNELLTIGALTVREGAVGVLDTGTGVVSFRSCDVNGYEHELPQFTRQQMIEQGDKVTFEDGL